MSRHLLMVLALTMFTSLPVYAQTTPPTAVTSTTAETVAVGTLIGREGNVSLLTAGGEAHPLSNNAPIHMHDVIETGPYARALIVLIDNTEITLGENAQLTIDEYIFAEDNAAANKARYSILRGAFLYASGLVAKKDVPDVSVNTPYANIGIRGTSFWGGEIDGAYGVLVTDGQVSVQSGRGRISVDKGMGTSLTAKTDIPTRAVAWEQEKIDRAVATITMKDSETLRARITEHADTQKAQREAYKTYLTKSLEERKLLKDTRTPSTRIDNVPTPAPEKQAPEKKSEKQPAARQNGAQKEPAPRTAPATPASAVAPVLTPEPTPALNKQLQQLNEEVKEKGADATPPDPAAAPSAVPAIELPAMQGQQQPTRRLAPASGTTGKSKAADAL